MLTGNTDTKRLLHRHQGTTRSGVKVQREGNLEPSEGFPNFFSPGIQLMPSRRDRLWNIQELLCRSQLSKHLNDTGHKRGANAIKCQRRSVLCDVPNNVWIWSLWGHPSVLCQTQRLTCWCWYPSKDSSTPHSPRGKLIFRDVEAWPRGMALEAYNGSRLTNTQYNRGLQSYG